MQEILSATVAHKEVFQQLVSASPRLRLVDMPGWAGLGGVRFIPQGWESLLLTDQAKEELNRLNIQMVERLRVTDAAFSLGTFQLVRQLFVTYTLLFFAIVGLFNYVFTSQCRPQASACVVYRRVRRFFVGKPSFGVLSWP